MYWTAASCGILMRAWPTLRLLLGRVGGIGQELIELVHGNVPVAHKKGSREHDGMRLGVRNICIAHQELARRYPQHGHTFSIDEPLTFLGQMRCGLNVR